MSNNVKTEEKGLPRVKPATDIVETDEGFFIYMDIPGIPKESLIIDLNEDEIKVSGRTDYPAPDGEKLIHVEFGNGEYYRGFTLSHIVDKARIKATVKNGVLELHLPKAEKAQPRKIEIQMG
ncbi:MAG: Hsp20/alpha crystallin family protein [Desulfovibrio sp.]|nr:Hsp20/alpha crystallin family protein [Desulfovibrio sp.]MBI4959738.1 Hsp20/alpha crystallin family protein [Desulfovibrio sp.]